MTKYLVESGLILGLITIILLFSFRRKRSSNNHFLAISLFCIWYSLLLNFLNQTGEILDYPYLIRTGNITGYLILVFLYIYARNTFYPGEFWLKTDWLFLLPAVFYTVDMTPFFLSGSENKVAVMQLSLGNQARMFSVSEGWIKIRGFHFVFRYIWGFFMMSLLISLIFKNRRLIREKQNPHNRKLFLFIVSLTALYMPLLFPGIIGALFHMHWFSLSYVTVVLAIVLTVSSIYFLLSPSILYGFLPKPIAETTGVINSENGVAGQRHTPAEPENEPGDLYLKQNETDQIIGIIEGIMQEKSPFLNKEYTIHDLGNDTGVPVYQLSPIINQHYHCNFNSWLNKYRIDYFIRLCADPENRGLTIEALSKDSGFSNRTTFSTAFKKEKNQTPGSYLKQLYASTTPGAMTY